MPRAAPHRCARSILPCRLTQHWCSSRASSPHSRDCGTHSRSACVSHRLHQCARCGPGGWCSPRNLIVIALRRTAMRRTGSGALSCRPVPQWRCSSRASGARPRCCGIHAWSARDLHRWRHSAWSGLRGWCPPPGLSPVAPERVASRHTGASALSCRPVPQWRCSSRASSARGRCCGSHARNARGRHRLRRLRRFVRSGPGGCRPLLDLSAVASR